MTNQPPEHYVPTSNDDLVRQYASHVEKWVSRHNKVPSAQEDLVQHVWERLISNRVIDKYRASHYTVPQKFTGPQVASLLGITFEEWSSKMWRGEDPAHWTPVWGPQPRKDLSKAHCAKCGSEMVSFERGLQTLRDHQQTSKSEEIRLLGINPQTTFWWGTHPLDSESTICVFCAPRIYGEGLRIPTLKGVPWWGEKAFFHRADVETSLGRPITWETEGKARSAFKGYLALTVSNCVKNWFRTKSRRHQEVVQEPDPVSGRSWEESLVCQRTVPSDVEVDLKRAIQGLQAQGRSGRNLLAMRLNQAKV